MGKSSTVVKIYIIFYLVLLAGTPVTSNKFSAALEFHLGVEDQQIIAILCTVIDKHLKYGPWKYAM